MGITFFGRLREELCWYRHDVGPSQADRPPVLSSTRCTLQAAIAIVRGESRVHLVDSFPPRHLQGGSLRIFLADPLDCSVVARQLADGLRAKPPSRQAAETNQTCAASGNHQRVTMSQVQPASA
jgi:hypothetical protein